MNDLGSRASPPWWTFAVFGVASVAVGFLAAFTLVGALFVWLGVAAFATTILVACRVQLAFALLGGAMVFAALAGYTILTIASAS